MLSLFLLLIAQASSALASDPVSTKRSVGLAVYVIDISEVQELAQAVVADFVVIARWQQPDLADSSAPVMRLLPLDEVDAPRLIILNGRRLREKMDKVVEVNREGVVVYRQRYQGTVSTAMNLENFPMDRQILAIEVGSLDFRNTNLVPDETRSGAMRKFTVAGWQLEPMKLRGGEQVAPDGIHTYSTVTAAYSAVRNGIFFTWKLFVPLGLIVMMAYTVFWLDPTLLSTQIAIATSTVFTLIAYNFALSHILPQVSYLTRADVYLLGSMLLVFSALGEAVVTGVLARDEERLALARRIDVVARYVYPALFVLVVILAFG